MSSILDALGEIKEPGAGRPEPGRPSAPGTGDPGTGEPGRGGESSDGGPPRNGGGRRPRWVSVVLVSGLGLALGVGAARLMGGSEGEQATAPQTSTPAARPLAAKAARSQSPAKPATSSKAAKSGAWPKIPRAKPGLPPELARHPGATKSSPWPAAENKDAKNKAAAAVPSAVPAAPSAVPAAPKAAPAAPKVAQPEPLAKDPVADAEQQQGQAAGLAAFAAARAKARVEGGQEGVDKFEQALAKFAEAAKKSLPQKTPGRPEGPQSVKASAAPPGNINAAAAAKKVQAVAPAKPPRPDSARPAADDPPATGLAALVAARKKALAEGGQEGLERFDKGFAAMAKNAEAKARVLESPPTDAPRIEILFIQWGDERAERLASLRSQGGSLSVVYEGDVIDGMAVASIKADAIHFTWRGQTFRQPVHRY